jgi:HPt (histidine-containing phosphotransfer) domain-containing protein
MQDPFLRKKFIFNDNIDSEFLFSLYENDYEYIEEIFKTTLDQVEPIVNELQVSFENEEVENIRRMVHKIKPAFGFTGFIKTERTCQEFEDTCTIGLQADQLAILFNVLFPEIVSSVKIMREEYDELKEFNRL